MAGETLSGRAGRGGGGGTFLSLVPPLGPVPAAHPAGVLRQWLSTLGARGAGLREGPGQNSPAHPRAGVVLSCHPCLLVDVGGQVLPGRCPPALLPAGVVLLQSCA